VELTKRTHRVHKDITDLINEKISHQIHTNVGLNKEQATQLVFNDMDDNKDGYISQKEFRAKMAEFNIFITRHVSTDWNMIQRKAISFHAL
jgi:Ca2+-binding EF-hand superfamily protein